MMALVELGLTAIGGIVKTWMVSSEADKAQIEADMMTAVKGLLAVRKETSDAHDERLKIALEAIKAAGG
jgi:hypothetical protein